MNNFFDDILPISEKQWKNKVQVELQGLEYNKTLVWGTSDHINVKPLYTTTDFEYKNLNSVYLKKNNLKFISKYNSINENNFFNAYYISKIDLENKIDIPNDCDLYIKYNENLDFNLIEKVKNNKFLDFDIYGYYAQNGLRFKETRKGDRNLIKEILKLNGFKKIISIQADVYQNAGANHIQQIAIALSHAVEYIEEFGSEIADKIYFKFALGSNLFFEIAKLRAFRFLWRLILEQYNIKSEAHIVSSISERNKSQLDSNNNIVRSSLEIYSAILGNSDAVFIENNFTYSTIESDYISGSYYVENLTDQIAEKALELFKTIQNSGGFIKSIENETIQDFIYTHAKKEQKDFDDNVLKLIGVNKNKISIDNNDKMKNEKVIKQVLFLPIVPTRLAEKEERK